MTTRHIHLGAGAGSLRPELTAAHLPTGWVALQDVLRLAIEAFGVRPLRPDWDAVLTRTLVATASTHPPFP
ncbi:MAG: hypothetical protein ACR2PL_21930 [Dehalococcoidia bacterium]